MATAMGTVKAKAKATATAKTKVKLTAMATGMVKARSRVKAKVTATDRQRVEQFAAQADSVASAWSRQYSTARSVAEAVDSLLHQGSGEILPVHPLLDLDYSPARDLSRMALAPVSRSRKVRASP
jgi:hypothetical protein